MLFSRLSSLILYFYLFYQYLNNKYPEKIQTIIINVTYSCVYIYSKCQIGLSKMSNIVSFYMIKYLPNIYELITTQYNENHQNELWFTFVLNNDPIITMSKTELLYNLENKNNDKACDDCNDDDAGDFILDGFDLILIRDNKNNIKIVKKSEFNFENIKSNNSDVLKIEPVQYKPILCELLIEDDNIKIDFKDKIGNYNYLILNNSFDCKFLSYFMKQHYNILDIEDYTLRVLDDSVNTMEFDKTNVLHIGENKLIQI